jgi:hypothetical protein
MKLKYLLCLVLFGATSWTPQTGKFGALAVDRSNGFYYGWAVDYKTQSEANNRALTECNNRGGNCSIVLRWSGGQCAAYKTIKENVGTAYGWGVARSRAQAEAIATNECLKRSNGVPCSNYVWGCNSKDEEEEEEEEKKEKEQPDPNKNSGKDGFWSGNSPSDQGSNNKQGDFWDGKGTDDEERRFESQTKPPQKNQFIGDIESYGTKYLTVQCIDHGQVDGDRVSVKVNGETIRTSITLTGYYTTFDIQLKSGQNRIDFTALNEGSASPNTAKFIIKDDTGKTVSDKEWNITTGYTATLLIVTY